MTSLLRMTLGAALGITVQLDTQAQRYKDAPRLVPEDIFISLLTCYHALPKTSHLLLTSFSRAAKDIFLLLTSFSL